VGQLERGWPMPTDLEAVLARKREAQSQKEKQRQNDVTMISIWVVICLVMLVLLFVDNSYAQAMEELMDLF
jgi:predicted nucleic acid-binding Zn ribbon protein